jgi:hypothetical protein
MYLGPDIDGRPILDDVQPGVRHIAYRVGRTSHYVTYCGLDVPDDHRCPTEAEIHSRPPWTPLNCYECHRIYSAQQIPR